MIILFIFAKTISNSFMGIFIRIIIILALLIIPIFLKISTQSKILFSFFLGLIIIPLLIKIEFFSSPNYSSYQGDALLYLINWIAYIVFNAISSLIGFIKKDNRREYFFFFPTIAAFIVFIFTSFDALEYSSFITGNILLTFLPLYVYIYYFKYKKKKLERN